MIKGKYFSALDNFLIKYPYFQIGQILLVKGLQNNDSIRYHQQLKKAAAYSIDRKKLFDLIELDKHYFKNKKNILEKNTKHNNNNNNKPLSFNNDVEKTFSEWLSVLNTKKIKRDSDIIEEFIENKIQRKKSFFKATDYSQKSLTENQDLITPTLARVYLKQGYYDKAIEAYEKLSLKYPKKNTFFANQIKLITKLNKK